MLINYEIGLQEQNRKNSNIFGTNYLMLAKFAKFLRFFCRVVQKSAKLVDPKSYEMRIFLKKRSFDTAENERSEVPVRIVKRSIRGHNYTIPRFPKDRESKVQKHTLVTGRAVHGSSHTPWCTR